MKSPKGFGWLIVLAACVLGGYLLGQSKPIGSFGSGTCPVCQLVNQFGAKDRPAPWDEYNPRSKIDRKYRRDFRRSGNSF